jgi:hypothetical protein
LPTQTGFVAQCVSFDFAAQGKDVPIVLQRFQKAFMGQMIADLTAARLPFSTMKQTPARYQIMYQKAFLSYGALSVSMPSNAPPYQGQPVAPPNVDVKIWGSDSWAA